MNTKDRWKIIEKIFQKKSLSKSLSKSLNKSFDKKLTNSFVEYMERSKKKRLETERKTAMTVLKSLIIVRSSYAWVAVCAVVCAFVCTVALPSASAFSNSKLQINIDNPEFRPLVIAIPDVERIGDESESSDGLKSELQYLLEFSGMFKVVGTKVYSHLNKGNLYSAYSPKVHGSWKQLGVEGLVLAAKEVSGEKITYRVKVIDIATQRMVLDYSLDSSADMQKSARMIGDKILMSYTGRPGIFTTKIVFIGRRAKGEEKQVFMSDFDGKNLRQLTSDKVPHLSPSWSPDGKHVVYTSYKAGDPDLYQQNIETGEVKRLSGYRGIDSGGQYDLKSDLIAFSGAVKGDTDIYVVSRNGGKRKALIKGRGLDVDPAFSPNGKWMAFVSGRFGNPHIFRADLTRDGGRLKVVSDKRLTWAGWYNGTPAWSHDSEKIAFAGYDRETDRFDLFMVEPNGKKLERLTLRTGDNESPSWAPNSQLIVFHSNRVGTANVKGKPHLWVMRRDGSYQRKIETGLYEAQTPKWGPFLPIE